MATISLAHTSLVNPPSQCSSSTPLTLSVEDLWTGLLHKCRNPQKSIASIAACEVLWENSTVIEREITVRPNMGMGAGGKMKERIELFAPMKAVFTQPYGTIVENIISRGSGGEDDLYMTFTFQWKLDDIAPGSIEEGQKRVSYVKLAQTSVETSLQVIREMKIDGTLYE